MSYSQYATHILLQVWQNEEEVRLMTRARKHRRHIWKVDSVYVEDGKQYGTTIKVHYTGSCKAMIGCTTPCMGIFELDIKDLMMKEAKKRVNTTAEGIVATYDLNNGRYNDKNTIEEKGPQPSWDVENCSRLYVQTRLASME